MPAQGQEQLWKPEYSREQNRKILHFNGAYILLGI